MSGSAPWTGGPPRPVGWADALAGCCANDAGSTNGQVEPRVRARAIAASRVVIDISVVSLCPPTGPGRANPPIHFWSDNRVSCASAWKVTFEDYQRPVMPYRIPRRRFLCRVVEPFSGPHSSRARAVPVGALDDGSRSAGSSHFDKRAGSTIPSLFAAAHVPGLSIALVRNGQVAWARGFGVKNSSPNAAVDANTLFEAGSVSKTVFAYAVMKLCEKRVLDLDRPPRQLRVGAVDHRRCRGSRRSQRATCCRIRAGCRIGARSKNLCVCISIQERSGCTPARDIATCNWSSPISPDASAPNPAKSCSMGSRSVRRRLTPTSRRICSYRSGCRPAGTCGKGLQRTWPPHTVRTESQRTDRERPGSWRRDMGRPAVSQRPPLNTPGS